MLEMDPITMTAKDKLFELMKSDEPLLAPGGWNAISVKMIEAIGFRMSFITGGGITESMLGLPDIGSITMSEMVSQVKNICAVTSIPVIADSDSGFGNAMNAMRPVSISYAPIK